MPKYECKADAVGGHVEQVIDAPDAFCAAYLAALAWPDAATVLVTFRRNTVVVFHVRAEAQAQGGDSDGEDEAKGL